jgi:chemotaxis protein MotB
MELGADKEQIRDISDFSDMKRDSEQWMISYADVVTVLLCFFILFFNQDQVTDFLDITSALKGEEANSASGGEGANPSSGNSKDMTSLPERLSLEFKAIDSLVFSKSDKELQIDFHGIAFFNKGSDQLTKEGQDTIDRILAAVRPHQEGLFIEIQGHSDPAPVSARTNRRYKSNIELSTFRALTVYRHFMENGIEGRAMSVAGFSDHKPLNHAPETPVDTNDLRRVTFKIEVKNW